MTSLALLTCLGMGDFATQNVVLTQSYENWTFWGQHLLVLRQKLDSKLIWCMKTAITNILIGFLYYRLLSFDTKLFHPKRRLQITRAKQYYANFPLISTYVEQTLETPMIWDAITLIMTSLWWNTMWFANCFCTTMGCWCSPWRHDETLWWGKIYT